MDVDAVDVQGMSALALAAVAGKDKAVGALLRGGGGGGGGGNGASSAQLDIPNAEAKSALHHAAFEGHLKVVKRLVRAGAVVDLPSALTNGVGPGHTPLLLAAYNGHYKVAKYLLQKGANPNFAAKVWVARLVVD